MPKLDKFVYLASRNLVHAFIVNRLDHCSSLYCGLPQVRMQPLDGVLRTLLGLLVAFPRLDISVKSCEIHSTGSLSGSAFTIGSPPLFGAVSGLGIAPTYLLELFILTSSCTGPQSLRSASRGDFVVSHARTAIKQHRAFSITGGSLCLE